MSPLRVLAERLAKQAVMYPGPFSCYTCPDLVRQQYVAALHMAVSWLNVNISLQHL